MCAASRPLQAAVATARDLILNYAGLALFAGMIPQVRRPCSAGPCHLGLLSAVIGPLLLRGYA